MKRVALSLLALLALAAPVFADANDTAEAKRLYQSGTKHFALSEYEQAVADFKEGYRRKEDPVFLYNVAQCYRQMKGHEEDALKFYRSYLRQQPNATNREDVERKIEGLEKALAEQAKLRSSPPATPMAVVEKPSDQATEKPAPKPLYKKWWLWTTVGAVVVVGVGVGLGVGLTLGKSSQTNFPPIQY